MYTEITYEQMHATALNDLDTVMELYRQEGTPEPCYTAARDCLDEYDHGTVDLLPEDTEDTLDEQFNYRFARQLYVAACMHIAHYTHGEYWDADQLNALFTIDSASHRPFLSHHIT